MPVAEVRIGATRDNVQIQNSNSVATAEEMTIELTKGEPVGQTASGARVQLSEEEGSKRQESRYFQEGLWLVQMLCSDAVNENLRMSPGSKALLE